MDVQAPKGYKSNLKHMQRALDVRTAKLQLLRRLSLRYADPPHELDFSTSKKQKKPRKLILNLNVNIDESSRGTIKIWENDNPKVLASAFARKYQITEEMRAELEELIKFHIDKYTRENPEPVSPRTVRSNNSPGPETTEEEVDDEETNGGATEKQTRQLMAEMKVIEEEMETLTHNREEEGMSSSIDLDETY